MSNQAHKISGVALLNRGIGFFSQRYSVFSYWRKGQIITKVKPVPRWLQWMKNNRFLKIPASLLSIFLHIQFLYTFLFLLFVELWITGSFEFLLKSYHAFIQGTFNVGLLESAKGLFLILLGLWLKIPQRINTGRMYHGAEHKSIACSEIGLPLTYQNIAKQSRIHNRCGSVLIFLVLPLFLIFTYAFHIPDTISFICSIVIAAALKKRNYRCLRWSNTLGGALQYLTTKEPTGEQLLVAQQGLQTLLTLESEILA